MENGNSEERNTSASSMPRMPRNSTTFFGRLTKRSSRVAQQPLDTRTPAASSSPLPLDSIQSGKHCQKLQESQKGQQKQASCMKLDMSFAKCSPDKRSPPAPSLLQTTHPIHGNHFSATLLNEGQDRLLPVANRKNNNNNSVDSGHNRSSSIGGLISLNRIVQSSEESSANKTPPRPYSTDGSQSDGGEVILRAKTNKHRSLNHNRFSHQLSLCCKVEKKTLTPPVSVRYNSIPDGGDTMRRDNLSLCWSMADNTSLSLTTSDANSLGTQVAASGCGGGGGSTAPHVLECASAPESPVTAKSMFAVDHAFDTPSNSLQSGAGLGSGPIRPLSVEACRSRLRLKLYPPDREMPLKSSPFDAVTLSSIANGDSIWRATTPQHMSSPNIATQPAIVGDESEQEGKRFMSHENIQMQRQPSSSSLVRQALMLSLIPTKKARDRSYLDGRLGSSSLLGSSELNRVLPNKAVTIFVGTWNMNGQSPPKQMNDFVLPASVEHLPDIVAVGTQESSPDRFEWEVTLQETLGPSHVLFYSTALGTLHLAVYMRRDLIWYCSAPEDASMSVRTGSAFRTKGAVAISFCLFGSSMLFVSSHLTAHQQKVKERVSDVKRIINALDLPKNLNLRHKNKDVTQNFDNVFWCGDLNFRLGEPREKLLEWIQNTKFPLPSHLPHGYMHTDQLSSVLADGAAFRGFMEANITFPPTYKYDPGTQHFDTSSKQRAPAYTDRILYKYRQSQGLGLRRQSLAALGASPVTTLPYVQCLFYDSVPSIITSDHKPVWALFRVSIRAGSDAIPLAAGLFNRDIYLEGMKRRLNNQYSGSSAVCTIQ